MHGGAGWFVCRRNAGESEPECTALRTSQVLLGNYRGGGPTATDPQGSALRPPRVVFLFLTGTTAHIFLPPTAAPSVSINQGETFRFEGNQK